MVEVLPAQTFRDESTQSWHCDSGTERGALVPRHVVIRHSTGIVQTLRRLAHDPVEADWVAFSLRPELLWDYHLVDRIHAEISHFAASDMAWVVLVPHGRDRNDRELLSAWFDLDHDLTPARGRTQIVSASGLLYVVNVGQFRRYIGNVLASSDTEDFMNAMVSLGYLDQVPSYFSSRLFPVLLGRRLLRSTPAADAIGRVESLLPGVAASPSLTNGGPGLRERLESAYARAADLARDRPVFSFVVRTLFKRPHLLNRCLISIDYIRRTLGVPAEIVLASDVDDATFAANARALQGLFPGLVFTRANAANQTGASRVRNLKEGVRSTTGERVCVIDDDDYYLPHATLAFSTVLEPGFEGLLLLGAQVVNEEWTATKHKPEKRVLSYGMSYPAWNWKATYGGNNSLPLSSIVYPGDYARRLIEDYHFDHDLSEDFLLHLGVLSDPFRPCMHVTDGICVHQSHRSSSDNVSGVPDRTAWCLDTGNGVYDLLFREGRQFEDLAASERVASRLGGLPGRQPEPGAQEHELREALDAARRQLMSFASALQDAEQETRQRATGFGQLRARGASLLRRLLRSLRSVR